MKKGFAGTRDFNNTNTKKSVALMTWSLKVKSKKTTIYHILLRLFDRVKGYMFLTNAIVIELTSQASHVWIDILYVHIVFGQRTSWVTA